MTPEEDAAYTDGYREGFTAGAKAQREACAQLEGNTGAAAGIIMRVPLVEPPAEPGA